MLTNYNTKKTKNQKISNLTDKHLKYKTQKRFCECGKWIDFFADRELSKLKVYEANFCKNRFCPMCAWRKAHKDAMMISILMEYIEKEHDKAFIFVTLTAPNVKGEDLKDEITRYNKAFKKLVERDVISKINQGYIRKLEVTYDGEPKITKEMYKNKKAYYDWRFLKIGDDNPNYDMYHPHFHCVFAVNPSYFKSRDYIKQEKWLDLWCDVMKDQAITQVDVRRIKRGGTDAHTRDSAINEVAKYAAKDSDYGINQVVFDAFYDSLKGRQVLTFNDLFSQANKKYKAKELEHYKTIDETNYVFQILYRWGGAEYLEKRRREITEEEYRRMKKEAVDEAAVT